MSTILIVMWFAMSQSYQRETVAWPQVAMQAFASKAACERAAATIRQMANGKTVSTVCVPTT